MSTAVTSLSTRKRGRGDTADERKRSRAAFKAWDTRRATAARRSAAAKKAARTRKRNAATNG